MNRQVFVVGVAVLAACGGGSSRDNPYDPFGEGPKAPGRLRGTVLLEGHGAQGGVAVQVWNAAGARVDGGLVTREGGLFVTADLQPGRYQVEVGVPADYRALRLTDVELLPGQDKDLGLLWSAPLPPTGVLQGQVLLEDPAQSPAGVLVVATRLSGGPASSLTTLTDANGLYRLPPPPPRGDLVGGGWQGRTARSSHCLHG